MDSKSRMLYQEKETVKLVADFFLALIKDPLYFNEIVEFFSLRLGPGVELNRIRLGMLTIDNFNRFMTETGRIKGLKPTVIAQTITVLEDNLLIYTLGGSVMRTFTYQPMTTNVKNILSIGILDNILFGIEYIIDHYRKAVFKIENTSKNGNKDLGTGFLTNFRGYNLIVTNEHVLAEAVKVKLLDVDNNEYDFEIIYTQKDKDLAIIQLTNPLEDIDGFRFNTEQPILSDIITMGYPSIPLTKEAYQVIHRGEINSHIENYFGNKMFLISAKTSSGNSGSPVIDSKGLVVGIIAQELFEKGALLEKGKLPYYGVIPSQEIIEILKTNIQ